MISLIPIGRMIVMIACFYAIVPVMILHLTWIEGSDRNLLSSIPVAFVGSSILGIIIWVFFALGWRWLWQKIPYLNESIFPDLNGEWDMRIAWQSGSERGIAQAHAIIRQDFLKVSMEVHSEKSDSETLLAVPKKDYESGRPGLTYVYRVVPKRTEGRSDSPYLGTALLKLSSNSRNSLEGNYYTDAATQGHFQLIRRG